MTFLNDMMNGDDGEKQLCMDGHTPVLHGNIPVYGWLNYLLMDVETPVYGCTSCTLNLKPHEDLMVSSALQGLNKWQ